MIIAIVFSLATLTLAAILRAGLTSAIRTNRADALRAAADGKRGAGAIARLLEERDLLHPSINAVQSFLLLAALAPMVWIFTDGVEGPALVWRLVIPVTLYWVIGDFLARGFGRARAGSLAYSLAPILIPVVRFGTAANEFIADDETEAEEIPAENGTDEEEEERELIDSVLEFTDTIVREVMVPRQDVVTVPADAEVGDLVALSNEHGYSRYPVTDPDGDVIGVVLTKDVLGAHAAGRDVEHLTGFVRDISFVPENKRASDLLREMQTQKAHLAMVVDEYGDTTGVVSIEDLLEELVGEIADEHDSEEELLESIEDGVYRADGRLEVQALGDAFSIELPDEEWDTVAGLVLGLAGRVPEEGERFEINGLELEVDRLQGRRVSSVLARRA
ncbi:MAG TPA: hemolysin family protein [Acidimicrobiia bacterium]|nr:hemolysin family protein [Acidimicrobiia bacterium]